MTAADSGEADEAQPSSDKTARLPSTEVRQAEQPGPSRSPTPAPVALTPLASVAGPSTTLLSPPAGSPDAEDSVKPAASARSLGSFGRRSRPKSTTSSSQASSQQQQPRRYPTPLPATDGAADVRKNHDALFSFHLPHPTTKASALAGKRVELGGAAGQMPTFQDDGLLSPPAEVEGKSRVMELALVRMTSKEGPLDAYLPQSGPNAFYSQAYLPSTMPYPLPAASLLAASAGQGSALPAAAAEEDVVTRDDYDRIGGRTGVGWMACCAGMLLFTCTDCCCCCC